jgi:Neocarzinostatin family/DisA bacterial checkpoint controller nucleotide-binding
MRQRRQWVRGLVATVATVAVAVGASPVAAHASGGPKIVVTPSTGLVSGQTVRVDGSGFAATTDIAGVECPVGASDPNSCDLGNVAFVASDAHGAFATKFVMHRTLLGSGGLSDCAPKACELLFAPAADFLSQATAPVKFDPNVPLPPTTASVTPATDLADGQVLKVNATGFTLNPQVYVTECVVAAFSCAPAVGIFTHPNGTLTTKFAAHRVLVDGTGTRVDCASSAGSCEILIVDLRNVDYHATAALEFNPNLPPPPPPSLNVHPDTNLPYYARVTMYGKHWTPGDFVLVMECQTKASFACTQLTFVQPDNNGVIQAQPMLERKLVDDFNPGSPPVDCAKAHAGCALVAISGNDGSSVTVPVTFDPNAPIPPKPSAHIRPAAPYQDQQTVNITGKNFAPRAGISVTECAVSLSSESCLFEGGSPAFTSATGGLSTQFQLFSPLQPGDPTSDCTALGVQCTLEVASEGGGVVALPLTFTGGAAAAAPRAHSQIVRLATSRTLNWATAAPSPCFTGLTTPRSLRATALRSLSTELACSALRRATRGGAAGSSSARRHWFAGRARAVASVTMAEAAARRLRRIADELDEIGVRLEGTEAFREMLVYEIDHALRPAVHERRVASHGTILEPLSDPATWASGAQLDFTRGPVDQPLADARRFADGASSWILRETNGTNEWMVFDRPAGSERDLVVLAGVLDATIIQRHRDGFVRVVGRFGVLRWQRFSWHHEPPVSSWIDTVTASSEHGDPEVLEALLEFAVHDLGSRGIGSLLIYRPDNEPGPRVEERLPSPPPLRIRRAAHLAPLRHALTQVDGAAIFNAEGVLRQLGVRLVPSDDAERSVEAFGGTRHTSGRRYSYDDPLATVVAVSEDGPVSVLRNSAVLGRSHDDD